MPPLRPVHLADYAAHYAVAEDGRIFSLRRRLFLRPARSRGGYWNVGLHVDGAASTVTVHRLVACAWLEPGPVGAQINHKDGDKGNNHASNLEWVTPLENTRHALATGLAPHRLGETNPNARWTAAQVEYIRSFPYKHGLFSKLARELGTAPCSIRYAYYWWGGNPRPYKR
jgi:hypothetical protein